MPFTVAITTYNRPLNLAKLVNQVTTCTMLPDEILVIDSSDQIDESMKVNANVTYVRSSHKNQPYQRYLAYLLCKTEIIIFLDDDLEIIDFGVFEVMIDRLHQPGIRGVSTGFIHHSIIAEKINSQVDGKSFLFRAINFLSGVPILKPGKIYLAGLAGPRPTEEGPVDYFNGAIMGFYKDELKHLFDQVLFTMFERRYGMGEDKIISMEVGLTSKLWFVPNQFFIHPPTVSNYFQNVRSFQCKIMYSRLYLSLRYGKLKRYPDFLIYVHYYYFAAWRFVIAGVQYLANPSQIRLDMITGILKGVLLTFTRSFNSEGNEYKVDWKGDAERDTNTKP